jgi:hypothetical protein
VTNGLAYNKKTKFMALKSRIAQASADETDNDLTFELNSFILNPKFLGSIQN